MLNQDYLDSKLVIENVNASVDKVVIKGTDDENAVNSLKKVATVKALVDVANLSNEDIGNVTMKKVPLKAYDKDGNILDVEIEPAAINVDVEVASPSKTLPIRVVPKGTISLGKAISSIQMSSSNVVVYGNQSVLDTLQYVTATVDVNDLKDDKEFKVELNKPKGVKSMSLNNITASLTLGVSTDKDIENVNIDVRNLSDKYTVQGLTENDIKVTVNVKGVDSVLKALTPEDIKAYINLKDYKPGEYEVPVKVEGVDTRVQYLSKTKKVKIRVVEK